MLSRWPLISNKSIVSDEGILARIHGTATRRAARGPGWLFVETAGGVHSPAPSKTTQADLYMALRLPVILVGDSKLGGVSATISAFEALKVRGYDVETILLFQDEEYENYRFLTDYFHQAHGALVMALPPPPERHSDPDSDQDSMSHYYESMSSDDRTRRVLNHLDHRHHERITRLESMSRSAHKQIWYPFTQQKQLAAENITVIDSARGDYFQVLTPQAAEPAGPKPKPVLQSSFDGSASWWTQGLGHGNPSLALAAAYAAGRYGHVMFAEAIHEPALALAETLLRGMRNPRLTRAFYSDNGSTGVEVALKMGLRAARVRYGWAADDRIGVLGLKGGYHGDTMGAMDCAEPSTYNEKVEWYEGKGFWFDYPSVKCTGGKWVVQVPNSLEDRLSDRQEFASLAELFDVEAREREGQAVAYQRYIVDTLKTLQEQGRKFGCLVMEPIVLGAGGMVFVQVPPITPHDWPPFSSNTAVLTEASSDPLFQRTLVKVIRSSLHLFSPTGAAAAPVDSSDWTGLPIVFDEVFTGLYRLGRFSAASLLGVNPDISVHAKLLTGGLVPLCATLASEGIFRAFDSDDKSDALLHGHSYTAHAVGCQVALQSLRELRGMDDRGEWTWAKTRWQVKSGLQSSGDSETGIASGGGLAAASGPSSVWSVWSPECLGWMSRQAAHVDGVWALGSVLAIHMKSADGAGYKSNAARRIQAALSAGDGDAGGWNVHSRVLGNVIYIMAGQKTTEDSIERIEGLLRKYLEG